MVTIIMDMHNTGITIGFIIIEIITGIITSITTAGRYTIRLNTGLWNSKYSAIYSLNALSSKTPSPFISERGFIIQTVIANVQKVF
jgi:hypothetical protein